VTFQIDSQKPKSTNSQCAVGRRIATINFANNSSQVTISEQNDLNKIAQCLESNPAYGARLNGHASKVGRQQHNLNLSKQRSENVKKELVSKYGVKSKQLSTAGYGDAQQIADNSTEAGQSKNRRVEAVITQ